MPKKITYIISNIDKAVAFEWIVDQLSSKIEFSFIFLGAKEGYLYEWLKRKNVTAHFVKYQSKKDFLFAWLKTYKLLKKIKPTAVHTHLFEANIIGLTTAKVSGVKKRIYTRHHSTFHHQYFPKAVKWDLRTNKLATDIVAISKNVQDVLLSLEHVPAKKVHLIHHGFDLKAFEQNNPHQVSNLKKKYNIPESASPIIGCISRYVEWKGIYYIIDAFQKITRTYPNAHLILANAKGPDQDKIKQYLQDQLDERQYTEIAFEQDLFTLYHLFDIYIHTPIDPQIEAFGQTYVEALAAGIPSVFTLSGVAHEFIEHKKNAWVVDYKDSDAIAIGITNLLNESALREELIINGKKSVSGFSLDLFTEKLAQLYEQ